VSLVFHQTLGALDYHVGHLHVTGWRFVESGGYYFATHRALHLGHFFRTLVDQQYDQMAFRVIARNRLRNVLHHDGSTGLGWRYDQTALAFANGDDEINDAAGEVFGGAVAR